MGERNGTSRVTFRVQNTDMDAVQEAVDRGEYPSRSEFIRQAVMEKLDFEGWTESHVAARSAPDDSPWGSPRNSWGDQERCQRCDAPKQTGSGDSDRSEVLRAVKLRSGRTEMMCRECFREAVDDDEVDPKDPKLEALLNG